MPTIENTGLSKLIMYILFILKPMPIHMKSFTNDTKAKEWLKHFLD
ncbi:MAG: hypothetical protein ACXVNQ_10380 [Bacteroidia bacterium]